MSSNQQLPQPLLSFHPLKNGVLLYEPPPQSAAVPANSPSVIILATWFAALPHQIARYTTTYQSLYPTASILILPTSIPDMVYRPYSTQRTNLLACIPIIQKHMQQPDHEILLHIFSNSGAHTACQLAHAYRSVTGKGLQLGAMILDSAPAAGTYRTMARGFIGGLPSTAIIKQLLSLMVYGVIGAVVLKEAITGEDNFIEKLRRDLNSQEVVSSKRGRVYIYSKEDAIVNWIDIERHARNAEEQIGAKEEVKLEMWEGSTHVAHSGKDPKRYWDAVRRLWEKVEEKEIPIKSRL